MKSLCFGLLAALAVLASAAGFLRAAEPAGGETWYSIVTADGAVMGHASQQIVQDPGGRTIVDAQEIDVGDKGDPSPLLPWLTIPKAANMVWRTERKEDATGHTISISAVARNGDDWSRNDARIADGRAEVTRTTPVDKTVTIVALPAAVRFDNGEGLLGAWDPAVTSRLTFENFNIDAMAVEQVTIEAIAGAPPDLQGRLAALRKSYENGELRSVARLLLDSKHRIVEARQPMFGASSIVIKVTDKETALRPHPAYRVLPNVMTKSLFRISKPAMRGHIRYRFSFRDGIEFAVPQTGEQRVAAEPGFATVDVCEDCGPGLPHDAAFLADALKPTAWLQSDAPAIKAIAEPIAKLAVSDSRKMELLRIKAWPYLGRIDFTGHFSALETLSRHSGDCTEAAVLLAALGRAAGIPTRVADGLVYSREAYHGVSNAFMPHSWTLAWADGKWRSFDLALDAFDATHIALTIGDGDERSLVAASQLAGLLHWESMAEIRARPAE